MKNTAGADLVWDGVEYIISGNIGTPPKTYYFLLDTGSVAVST